MKVTQEMIREAKKALAPLDGWARHCHGASMALVEAELWTCRVARGVCEGVGAQHSWVVIGKDCYDRDAGIIDPTLWSYRDDVDGIWTGSMNDGLHIPHGAGSIWEWGRPVAGDEKAIELVPDMPFSEAALDFLDMLGPLDRMGWGRLANAPVEGWPAAEIMPVINACVGPLVPIDIIGMLTNENPGNLYLARGREDEFTPPPFDRSKVTP
jgi:hypothetical protein